MKRNSLFISLAAALIVLWGCNPSNVTPDPSDDGRTPIESNDPGSSEDPGTVTPANPEADIYGNWSATREDGTFGMQFNEDGTFVDYQDWYKSEGTWKFDGSVLTQNYTKYWRRDCERGENGGAILDENGNYKWHEWEQYEEEARTVAFPTQLLYDKSTLVQVAKVTEEYYDEETGRDVKTEYEDLVMLLFKEGVKGPSDKTGLDGKWYWEMFGRSDVIRSVIIIDGNNMELIITPWGERYTGTFTYENGYLTMPRPDYTTTRYYKDPDDDTSWGDWIDDAHPENSEWRHPTGADEWGYSGSFEGPITMPFVVNGDQAYTILSNLWALMTRQ